MKNPFADRVTRDGLTIFTRYPGPRSLYYHVMKHQGRVRFISLCETVDESFKKLRQVRRELRDGRFDILDQIRLRQPHSTLEDLFVRYRAGAQAAAGTTPASIQQSQNALRNILRHVRLPNPVVPAGTLLDGQKLLTLQSRIRQQQIPDAALGRLPSTVFTADLLEQFKRLELAAAGTDRLALGRAAISANSLIRQARALFNKNLPPDFYKGLVLPDVAALRAVRLLPEPDPRFKMPAPAVLERLRANAALLKQTDPNCYIIYLLCLGCGLRPGEVKFGRQHWIETHTDGKSIVHVRMEDDFDTKSHKSRMVPIEDETLSELRQVLPAVVPDKPDYFLDGNYTERKDQAFRRFSRWVKSCGLDRLKAAHELRKVYGSLATEQGGLRVAQELLGHSSYTTTENHYVDQVKLHRVEMGSVLFPTKSTSHS